MFRHVHGPYTAAAFKNGHGAPNVVASKAGLVKMDALVASWLPAVRVGRIAPALALRAE